VTDLRQLLGVDVPLIQAPMAGAQDSALALAVSSAGALGSLPCAMLDLQGLRSELTTLQQHGRPPINVNFFCHTPPAADEERQARWRESLSPYYRELGIETDPVHRGPARSPFNEQTLEVLREFRPAVVSFHFGLPSADLLAGLRSWNATILSSATTVEEAVWLEARGVHAIIAQGLEAGGHRGHFLSDDLTAQLSTFALIPQIARRVGIPVIGAGGIADRAGIAAALRLGAAGVLLGTTFLLCPEARTGPVYRAALKSDASRHTTLTNVFSGRPARGIVNRLIRERGPVSPLAPPFPLAAAAVAPLRAAAESRGSGDFTSLWAGQNASGSREISATALVRDLIR